MSEYHVRELDYKDEELLIQVLRDMGYSPVIHKEAVSLYGYQGDQRKQKAHIIIPRKQVGSASNDVGFERTSQGLKLHISEYDERQKTFDTGKMRQTFASRHVINYINKKSKYRLKSQQTREDGRISIKLLVR